MKRKWTLYPVLASAGFVLPVALVNAADAETPDEASATAAAQETASDATPDVAAPVAGTAAQPLAGMPAQEYVVREGDTLGDIARAYLGYVAEWPRIARLNGIDDPTQLSVGTRLRLPQD